jgi:hypothetical protein
MAPVPRRRRTRTASKTGSAASGPSGFTLDATLLTDLGLGALPPDEANLMLAHIYETLELRVGMKLAERMTEEQLDEFERFIDENDEAGALRWLEEHFPDYREVVGSELEELKIEIRGVSLELVRISMERRGILEPSSAATATEAGKRRPVKRQRPPSSATKRGSESGK